MIENTAILPTSGSGYGVIKMLKRCHKAGWWMIAVALCFAIYKYIQDPYLIGKLISQVDLRIVVFTYNRPESLQKLLGSLQEVILDGDRAAVDIWIDRSKKGDLVHAETEQVARAFKWDKNKVTVHIQDKHVGIYGQWIDSWKPYHYSTNELTILLEDDVDLSPYAYRWLKAAHKKYFHVQKAGICLNEATLTGLKEPPSKECVFMYRKFCTQGYSPDPKNWYRFQQWYHKIRQNSSFRPYVKDEPVST